MARARHWKAPFPCPVTLDTDLVIVAIGSGANPVLTHQTKGMELNKRGYIVANETGRTSRPGVWAGCQKRRLGGLLQWYDERIQKAGGSPWTFLKTSRPKIGIFTDEGKG